MPIDHEAKVRTKDGHEAGHVKHVTPPPADWAAPTVSGFPAGGHLSRSPNESSRPQPSRLVRPTRPAARAR